MELIDLFAVLAAVFERFAPPVSALLPVVQSLDLGEPCSYFLLFALLHSSVVAAAVAAYGYFCYFVVVVDTGFG